MFRTYALMFPPKFSNQYHTPSVLYISTLVLLRNQTRGPRYRCRCFVFRSSCSLPIMNFFDRHHNSPFFHIYTLVLLRNQHVLELHCGIFFRIYPLAYLRNQPEVELSWKHISQLRLLIFSKTTHASR